MSRSYRPAIASNIPAIAEVAGDAAALFDPEQPEDIAAACTFLCSEAAGYITGKMGYEYGGAEVRL